MCTNKQEKDMGVTLSANLLMTEHYEIVALKANRAFGLIRRNIVHYVNCYKDIDILERFQRRAPRMVITLRKLYRRTRRYRV